MTCEAALENLKNTIKTRLPGAGTAAIDLELANAAVEFCLDTGVWRERITRNLVEGQIRYDMSPDTGNAQTGYIMELQIDQKLYRPLGGDTSGARVWRGSFTVEEDMESIVLNEAPNQSIAKGIEASITVIPEGDCSGIPEAIVKRNFEPLIDGAMGRLMSHLSKPYTNAEQARYHQRRFRAHITRVRRIVKGGNAKADPPWMFPQQAPGRQFRGARTRGGL